MQSWWTGNDIRTLEGITGLKETDYLSNNSSQTFAGATDKWWYIWITTESEMSITNIPLTMNNMGENIIDLICNSCSCDKTEAQEYLDSELQYLHELQDVDDLREGDIELACSNLGLDLDYQEYFINRLAGA